MVKCVGGSPDVNEWATTAKIERIEFTPTDFLIKLDSVGSNWPESTPPGWDGAIQFTLWVVIDGYATGCIEFWRGRSGVGGPFSKAAQDWYYFADEIKGHQPQAGEKVGFFVTQGDARRKDIHQVAEKSEIVLVEVPAGGVGVFDFTSPTVVPPVTPPIEPPTGEVDLVGLLQEILTRIKAIPAQIPSPIYEGTLFGYKLTLTPRK